MAELWVGDSEKKMTLSQFFHSNYCRALWQDEPASGELSAAPEPLAGEKAGAGSGVGAGKGV